MTYAIWGNPLFSPDRHQVRQFFQYSWRQHCQGGSLSAIESLAAEIIGFHPEFHALLELPEAELLTREWPPEDGTMNPFLHLSLHLALEEQLRIDQPPGIRAVYTHQCRLIGVEHDARHRLMECLGEVVWESQRHGTPPDPKRYWDLLQSLTQSP